MTSRPRPKHCPICDRLLTTAKEYNSCRCLDPGHWIAAGELAPNDFCGMARMVALIRDQVPFSQSPLPKV